MDLAQLVAATLGLSPPWYVSEVILAEDGRRLDVIVAYAEDAMVCPCCGSRSEKCGVATETWYHRDFLRYATYLHTHIPQDVCCGGRRIAESPWTRPGSKFVKIV